MEFTASFGDIIVNILSIIMTIITFGLPLLIMGITFILMLIIPTVGGILMIAGTAFWVMMIVDVLKRKFRSENDKMMWLLLIVFTHFIGAMIYYVAGRKTIVKAQEAYSC